MVVALALALVALLMAVIAMSLEEERLVWLILPDLWLSLLRI